MHITQTHTHTHTHTHLLDKSNFKGARWLKKHKSLSRYSPVKYLLNLGIFF